MMPNVADLPVPGSDEPALLVTPADGRPGPALLYLHWFDEAPNANRNQFLDEARAMAEYGITSLLPQLAFPWKSAPTDADSDLERIKRELMVLTGAIEKLSSFDSVDANRVAVVGHDFGAMYGILLMSSISTVGGVLVAPTARWADWFLTFWPVTGDRFDYMRTLDSVDPINQIGDIDAPLLFQFGTTDFYIAAMTAHGLKRGASEEARLKFYESGHAMTEPATQTDRMAFLLEVLGVQVDRGLDQ